MTDRRPPGFNGERPSRPSGSLPGLRDAARRQYFSLGTGELASVVTFTMLGVWVVPAILPSASDVAAFWSALAPLLFVLLQGGSYWLLARRWVGVSRMPVGLARTFWVLKWLNLMVIVGGLVGIVAWWPSSWLVAVLVLFTWAFGAVEYLNYFVVRLSYPARAWLREVRRWRTPRLIKDLRQAAHR